MNKSITITHFIGCSLYKDPTTNEWLCVGIISWAWEDSLDPWPQVEVKAANFYDWIINQTEEVRILKC